MREQNLWLVSTDRFFEHSFFANRRIWKQWSTQKCSYEGFSFICSNLPDAYRVEFTNRPWKTKNRQHHSLLVNQNSKFKKTVNLRAGRARKQRCTWFKQERIVLSRDNNAWRKTFECLVNCFMNLLVILSLIVVQITYRLIDEWSQWTKS